MGKQLSAFRKKADKREPELQYVLKKEIVTGTLCLDLGANIGYLTLLMVDRVGRNGKVFAIEPDPANVKKLTTNVNLSECSDRVKIFRMGVSNKRGKRAFYLGKASNFGGMVKSKNTSDRSIMVRVDTLTDFCTEHGIPKLIKMDIEGHEVEVLEGFYTFVKAKKFPCKIVMELHPMYYSEKHDLEYWLKKYLECGFRTKYVISAGVIQPDLFKKRGYKPIRSFVSNRGLYNNFSEEHMLEVCCHLHDQWMPHKKKHSPKIARYVMIER